MHYILLYPLLLNIKASRREGREVVVSITESLVQEVLLKYGDRAYYVLKAALEAADEYRAEGRRYPGDFDFRGLVVKLREWGFKYNPNQLLRILEREYGIIETSYKSAAQHWYVFTDRDAVEAVLSDYGSSEGAVSEIDDPEAYVLELQMDAVNVDSLLSRVKALCRKGKLSRADREVLREIIMNELPVVAKVMKEVSKYGNKYSDFIGKATMLMKLTRQALTLTHATERSVSSVELNGARVNKRVKKVNIGIERVDRA